MRSKGLAHVNRSFGTVLWAKPVRRRDHYGTTSRTGKKRAWKGTYCLCMNTQPILTHLDNCAYKYKTCELKQLCLQRAFCILFFPRVALLFGLLQHLNLQVAFSVEGVLTWQKYNISFIHIPPFTCSASSVSVSASSWHLSPCSTKRLYSFNHLRVYSFNHFSFTKNCYPKLSISS